MRPFKQKGIKVTIISLSLVFAFGVVNSIAQEKIKFEDRMDILQKIAEYSYTFDGKDAEGWANLFAEDGEWVYIIKGQKYPTLSIAGRNSIKEWAAKAHKTIPDTYRVFHHQSGTIFDEMTSDAARTRTMLILTEDDGADLKKGAKVTQTGIYHDHWVKTSNGWRIKKRVYVR